MAKCNSLIMTLNKCVFLKKVYFEAILVNYPNFVKSDFLQGDAGFRIYLQPAWVEKPLSSESLV